MKQHGISILEDFAGWGSGGTAASHILEVLIKRGEVAGDAEFRHDLIGGGIRCDRAADLLPVCRTALMAHDGHVAPQCVMGDMLQRTPPEFLERLDNLVASASGRVQAHVFVCIDM